MKKCILFLLLTILFSSSVFAFDLAGTTHYTNGTELGEVNITIEVYNYTDDLGPVAVEDFFEYAQSNASGWFNITNIEEPLGDNDLSYRPVLVKYSESDASYVSKALPQFDAELVADLGEIDFYLQEGATINISAYNITGGLKPFQYQIKDNALGYPVKDKFLTYSESLITHLPANRNYSLILYFNGTMPLQYEINNITDYTNNHLDLEFNVSDVSVKVSGNIFLDGEIGINPDLDFIDFAAFILEPGNVISSYTDLPYDMGTWFFDRDEIDEASGEYDITLIHPGYDLDIMMIFVGRDDGSDEDFIAYQNVTIGGNGNITGLNVTMYTNIGSTDHLIQLDDEINEGYQNVTPLGTNFSLINYTGGIIEEAFIEATVDLYSKIGMDVKWVITENDIDYDTGTFTIPVMEDTPISIQIFSSEYAPKKFKINVDDLADEDDETLSPIPLNLTEFNPVALDAGSSTIYIDMLKNTAECSLPDYDVNECSLLESNESLAEFNPFKLVIGGADMNFVIGNSESGMEIMYKNVDLLASGPPDVLFDSNSEDDQTGDVLEELWSFGSNGPEIYSGVLIKVPFNSSFDATTMNFSLPLLYNEDFEVIWNTSVNSSSSLPEDFNDFPTEILDGEDCSVSDKSANCFVNITNYEVWIKIPHFTGVESQFEGQEIGELFENATVVKTLLNGPNVENGSVAQFLINVTNTGTLNFINYELTDRFNFSFINYSGSNLSTNDIRYNDGEVEWVVNLTSSENLVILINFTAISTGVTNNSVDLDNGSGNFVVVDNASVTITTPSTPIENATITKTNLNASVLNGSIIEFIINVTNTGTLNLTNFTVFDSYNTTYLKFDNASGNYDASDEDAVDWLINLTIDESQIFYINFTAIAAGTTNNTVEFQNSSEHNFAFDNANVIILEETDSQNPIVTLISPINETELSTSQVDLSYNVTDNIPGNANCTLYLNNQKNKSMLTVINAPTQNFSFTNIPDNYYEWYVNCSDGSDNTNASNIFEFTIDTTAPVLSDETGPTSVNQGDTITIFTNWNYGEAGLNSGVIYVNDVAQGINNSPENGDEESDTGNVTLVYTTSSSEAGSNLTIYVSVNDTNNKWSNSSVFNVQINDTEIPVITLISPQNNSAQTTSTTNLVYNVTDNVAGNITCTLYLDYEENESMLAEINTPTQNFSFTNLPDDYYEWYVNCSDDAGNQDISNKFSFEKDTLAPVLESNITPNSVNQGDTITIFTNWNYGEAILDSGFMHINDVIVDTDITPSNGGDDDETGNITLSYTTNSSQAGSSLSINISVNDTNNRLSYELFSVMVNDTEAPVITLIGSNPQIIEVHTNYIELNSTSDDNADGNLTTSIVINSAEVNTSELGNYTVYYNVTDTTGNMGYKTRNVTVQDTTNPVLTLKEDNPQVIELNDNYIELGANATDNYDGTLTSSVVIDNSSVNTNVVANYTVTYNVTDSSDNSDYENRSVNVVDTTNPTFDFTPANQPLEYGTAFSYDVNATDLLLANYSINDTTNFEINNVGTITNVSNPTIGTYSINITINDTSGNENSTLITVTVTDTTLPYFTSLPVDQTINHTDNFGLQINGTDNFEVGSYLVNDTTRFQINNSGYLENQTSLDAGTFSILVTVNDTSGNQNTTSFDLTVQFVEVTNVTANNSQVIEAKPADTNLTLLLEGNVTTTITIGAVEPKGNGTTASLLTLKGVDINVDNYTKGNLTWAHIQIFYNETEISNTGIDESTLKIYYYNETSANWQLEPIQGVNVNSNYIWANVTHFSLFSVFGSAPSSPSTGGTSGGSRNNQDTEDDDNETCKEDWICGSWNDCINEEHSRICYELNGCGTTTYQPALTKLCELIEEINEEPKEEINVTTDDKKPEVIVVPEPLKEEEKPIWPNFVFSGLIIALIVFAIIMAIRSRTTI